MKTKRQTRNDGKRLAGLINKMLDAAQTLRIQQSQATSLWAKKYKTIADDAWRDLNASHGEAMEILRSSGAVEKPIE